MENRKKNRAEENRRNVEAGNPGDVDFIGMVRQWREEHASDAKPFDEVNSKITVCVRKRPVSEKERQKSDHDSVTVLNPTVWIHSAKFKVDGITKYLDHNSFKFDHAFDENTSTEDVYRHTTMPLLDFVCRGTGGRATVFAYGQTGSGKTYTMSGIESLLSEDLFMILQDHSNSEGCTTDSTKIMVSFFELYGGFVQDLLNDRSKLKVLEDGQGNIVVNGLKEVEVLDPAGFHQIVDQGNESRTTHSTEANDTSSRSHAVCQIFLRDKRSDKLLGKLSLVDLAGSERGTDTKSHNQQRRNESSEINTSLLALKECVRALDKSQTGSKRIPYRQSKLTLLLKDCFTSTESMTTMIATVSPGASSADHSLNTLRYADRIKEQQVIGSGARKKLSPKNSSISSKQRSPSQPISPAQNTTKEKKEVKKRQGNLLIQQAPAETTSLENFRESPIGAKGEGALRQTVHDLFEQEEEILSRHMRYIQENADLLTDEGKLLKGVQHKDVTQKDIDNYVSSLEKIIDRKEDMIIDLQQKLVKFTELLEKEEQLSTKTGSLVQY